MQRIEARERHELPEPVDYSEAKSIVLALSKEGKLADQTVNRFAIRREHQNVVAALALLTTVETDIIEPLLEQRDGYGLMIACRASRLNWQTTLAVVSQRNNTRLFSPQETEHCRTVFEALPLSIAQWTLRFGSVTDIAAKFNSTESARPDGGAGP